MNEASETDGFRTVTALALLWADREAGFNDVSSHLAALGYYLSRAAAAH